jgi:hypothetical protein
MLHLYEILSFTAFRSFSYSKFNNAATSCTDLGRNEVVFQIVKEESNILQTAISTESKRKEGWLDWEHHA